MKKVVLACIGILAMLLVCNGVTAILEDCAQTQQTCKATYGPEAYFYPEDMGPHPDCGNIFAAYIRCEDPNNPSNYYQRFCCAY
jgi:hypothetical protein